jgi:hypothetical protein
LLLLLVLLAPSTAGPAAGLVPAAVTIPWHTPQRCIILIALTAAAAVMMGICNAWLLHAAPD